MKDKGDFPFLNVQKGGRSHLTTPPSRRVDVVQYPKPFLSLGFVLKMFFNFGHFSASCSYKKDSYKKECRSPVHYVHVFCAQATRGKMRAPSRYTLAQIWKNGCMFTTCNGGHLIGRGRQFLRYQKLSYNCIDAVPH